VIRSRIREYASARTRYEKSTVLHSIVESLKSRGNGNGSNAHFVKKIRGRWYEISDRRACEKVGHMMREAVSLAIASDHRPRSDAAAVCPCKSSASPVTFEYSDENDDDPLPAYEKPNSDLILQQKDVFEILLRGSSTGGST